MWHTTVYTLQAPEVHVSLLLLLFYVGVEWELSCPLVVICYFFLSLH